MPLWKATFSESRQTWHCLAKTITRCSSHRLPLLHSLHSCADSVLPFSDPFALCLDTNSLRPSNLPSYSWHRPRPLLTVSSSCCWALWLWGELQCPGKVKLFISNEVNKLKFWNNSIRSRRMTFGVHSVTAGISSASEKSAFTWGANKCLQDLHHCTADLHMCFLYDSWGPLQIHLKVMTVMIVTRFPPSKVTFSVTPSVHVSSSHCSHDRHLRDRQGNS